MLHTLNTEQKTKKTCKNCSFFKYKFSVIARKKNYCVYKNKSKELKIRVKVKMETKTTTEQPPTTIK